MSFIGDYTNDVERRKSNQRILREDRRNKLINDVKKEVENEVENDKKEEITKTNANIINIDQDFINLDSTVDEDNYIIDVDGINNKDENNVYKDKNVKYEDIESIDDDDEDIKEIIHVNDDNFIKDERKVINLDRHYAMIVSKYFESVQDFINLMKTNKKYEDINEMFHFNPIDDYKFFPGVETQHFYKQENENEIIKDGYSYVYWEHVSTDSFFFLLPYILTDLERNKYKIIDISKKVYQNVTLIFDYVFLYEFYTFKYIMENKFYHYPRKLLQKAELYNNGEIKATEIESFIFERLNEDESGVYISLENDYTLKEENKRIYLESLVYYKDIELDTLIIPYNVKTIHRLCAVKDIHGIKKVIIKNVKDFFSNNDFFTRFFESLEELEYLELPSNVSNLGACFAKDCSNLTYCNIPVTKSLLKESFESTNLSDVIVPEGVKEIFLYCFANCTNLTSVVLPSTLETLDYGIFYKCFNLTNVNISNTKVKCIQNGCFSGCSKLENIILPTTLESLGDQCFYDCSSLKSINIPDGVTSIGYQCFALCTNLTSIKLSRNLKQIGEFAFKDTSIKYIRLPPKIRNLKYTWFVNCRKLKLIQVYNLNDFRTKENAGNEEETIEFDNLKYLDLYNVTTPRDEVDRTYIIENLYDRIPEEYKLKLEEYEDFDQVEPNNIESIDIMELNRFVSDDLELLNESELDGDFKLNEIYFAFHKK